jgi:hypothetical protein
MEYIDSFFGRSPQGKNEDSAKEKQGTSVINKESNSKDKTKHRSSKIPK